MDLQIHLSEMCNLHCKHCYQEECSDKSIMPFSDFKYIIDSYKRLYGDECYKIAITGGEPFLIPNIMDYISYGSKNFELVQILTNGTLITDSLCRDLQKIPNLKNCQMSLEGPKEVNDKIRGGGVFDKVLEKIKLLYEYNIRSCISCTITSYNYNKIIDLYHSIKDYPIEYLWFDRCVPYKGKDFGITKTQFKKFLSQCKYIRYLVRTNPKSLKRVKTQRALQFTTYDGGEPYICSAGCNVFGILSDGTVMPCRRLNIKIGNMLEEELESIIYRNRDILERIIDLPAECANCYPKFICNGGSTCQAYFKYKELGHKDIHCLRDHKFLPINNFEYGSFKYNLYENLLWYLTAFEINVPYWWYKLINK